MPNIGAEVIDIDIEKLFEVIDIEKLF